MDYGIKRNLIDECYPNLVGKLTFCYEKFMSMSHSFDVNIAAEYGIEEAIIIHHFQHWIAINKRLDRNFHEGRTWSYQTLDEISAHFPYLNKSKISDTLGKLSLGRQRKSKKDGLDFEPVLLKGNFNKNKYDHTVWYAFVDETKWILGNPNIGIGASQHQDRDFPTPIPDTKPYTEPKNVCLDPPVGGAEIPGSVEKVRTDGTKAIYHKDDLFRAFIREKKSYTTLEIQEAWEIFVNYSGAVYDLKKFVEGTIKNIRNKKNLEKMDKKACHSHPKASDAPKDLSQTAIKEPPSLLLDFIKNHKAGL